MREEDRYRSQAGYCREQATITSGAQAEQWLKIAAEYDRLLQAVVARPKPEDDEASR